MSGFKLSAEANRMMTSLQAEFPASFKKLQETFGAPNVEGDDYKVSTEWNFEDEKGEAVTLYDYKATKLYSDEDDYPSVEEFRSLPCYDWHIGARNEEVATRFIQYLHTKLYQK